MSSAEERTQQWIHVPNDPRREISQISLDSPRQGNSLFSCCESYIRQRPMGTLFTTLGLGIVVGVALGASLKD